MKKLLLALSVLTSSLSVATAQTEKGRWTVGVSVGNLNYQNRGNGITSFSADLGPSAGYFVANNLLVGTGIDLSLSTSNSTALNFATKSVTTRIGLSPFIRYYLGASSLKPYIGASYRYTYDKYRYTTRIGDVTGPGYSTAFVPTAGIAYFVNRTVALNAGLNYNILTTKNSFLDYAALSRSVLAVRESKFDYKSLSLSIGFQLFFGK